ncbi:hypothetical protein AGABI2DRAFT_195267 [Agaricus bisporus var. bisporus H97]|uniref:hypothetical protein n=1 Tax=Agaricus bisporus var. bisporus (strain H97 / ATCC MYA-4626 / FGSC 10389) TaxID=936046 RepID=UPI00029F6D9E|nr:hypothetical protein AGABI2DRAFT_195267 [Agaricus bisporus var. bisporus H97]EKV42997.1 hypothetical protein AGABI2DRAFT_195267 [Agaricus bisporus var. bisporus H97]
MVVHDKVLPPQRANGGFVVKASLVYHQESRFEVVGHDGPKEKEDIEYYTPLGIPLKGV